MGNRRRFQTTGICVPRLHYMVDVSNVVEQIARDYVENGEYSFVIDGEGVVVAHPDSMQIEELLTEFRPTMIFVEHDRAFVEKVANKIVEL